MTTDTGMWDDAATEQAAASGPPSNPDAEAGVLCAAMYDNRQIDGLSAVLEPKHFYKPAHGLIWTAMLGLYGSSKPVDPITVAQQLRRDGDLQRAGGAGYIQQLATSPVGAALVNHHAEIVLDCYQLRAVLEVSTRAAAAVHRREQPADEIRDQAMTELQAATVGTSDIPKLSVADRWQTFIDELEAGHDPTALDTPWRDLNEVVELKPGQLVVVGGATGGGKSLLGMNLGAHVALHRDRSALVASMEMGGSELLARLTAAEAGVSLDRLVRRKLDDHDWTKVAKVADRMQRAHHFILDDAPGLTISKIRARLRWMAARDMKPGIVIADYLQLMTPEGAQAGNNRAQDVGGISRGLKLLAGEFQIPVVALAQFNRNAVGRQPVVSDFKDSSSIEQDANVILLLHRPLAEDGTDTGPRAGEIDLIVAKNRNGAQGRIIPLTFQGHFARLRSMGRA
ncbi:replicative DNA helicase [Streptomyces sp. AA1529]|uniref:replicative DNA helicase n=1 Tax=Streptomyces sp. AA1529 TaxID=1203257 RepID=UPI0002E9F163|nr:DnaB-like helicase C-terminal domain-containing protein [Streptomyces sp. AA1529]